MNLVKASGILAAGIIVAVAVHSYLTPYQSCMRGVLDRNPKAPAAVICARHLGGAKR